MVVVLDGDVMVVGNGSVCLDGVGVLVIGLNSGMVVVMMVMVVWRW